MKSNRWFLAAIPIVIIIAGLLVIYVVTTSVQKTAKDARDVSVQNNTYVQVVACLLSAGPVERTTEYVKYCYEAAENANNTNVMRYGHGK